MTDEARAVAEVAKTTGEIVKAAGGVGSYLARVVGSIPDNLLGLVVGDWLDHARRRHLATLEMNTARILEGIATERLSEPSPSVLIPLLQAAVDEGRADLQAIWAALLANAMVDGGRKVRRDYFELLRHLEPVDALVFDLLARRPPGASPMDSITFIQSELNRLKISDLEYNIALAKLDQLGLLQSGRLTSLALGLRDASDVT